MEKDKCHFCTEKCVHNETADRISGLTPDGEALYEVANLFKIFGDSTRIRIMFVLFKSEMCVCDIADSLGMTQSAISHQLRILKQARLVKNRREGKLMIYSLDDDHVKSIFAQVLAHVTE